jgi:hyaluronoglucosaminidase
VSRARQSRLCLYPIFALIPSLGDPDSLISDGGQGQPPQAFLLVLVFMRTSPNTGIIEGFFGRSWDWSARRSGLDFLRDWGYQFYIYAPKADPFLRRRWREPMPEETLRHLSELSLRGEATGVCVGVGLTPFEIYLNYEGEARALLRTKVREINETGARILCILFDDMRGDVDGLADLQAAVVADVCAWSSARKFIVCPTYYSYDVRLTREFGPPPKTYLRDLGQIIDPRIDIFWTGEKVVSETYSAGHLIEVATDLRRRPFIWDNSISNDSKVRTDHLYLDPSACGWELPADLVEGLAINPMNQPHLTRIALCRFRQLLGQEPVLTDCWSLCGPIIAAQLQAYGGLMQTGGLSRIDPDTRSHLLATCESLESNPYAKEIADWLDHEYLFDPSCLTA